MILSGQNPLVERHCCNRIPTAPHFQSNGIPRTLHPLDFKPEQRSRPVGNFWKTECLMISYRHTLIGYKKIPFICCIGSTLRHSKYENIYRLAPGVSLLHKTMYWCTAVLYTYFEAQKQRQRKRKKKERKIKNGEENWMRKEKKRTRYCTVY
jgi:hypothetical protein